MTASGAAEASGLNAVVFGYGGSGKTTLIAQAQDTEIGRDVIIIDTDKGMKSLDDRDDVVVWRGPDPKNKAMTYQDIVGIGNWLATQKHTFRTIGLDSVTALYAICLKEAMKASPTPDMPSQPEYGKANTMILDLLRDWKEKFSVQRGWTFIATAHSEEQKDETSGAVLIRMSVTPGVVKGIYQIFDAVGYLLADPSGKTNQRTMLLRTTPRIIAKFRQAQSGPQLPLEITNPNLGTILEHVNKIKSFPQSDAAKQ